jgi:hypothetical protein
MFQSWGFSSVEDTTPLVSCLPAKVVGRNPVIETDYSVESFTGRSAGKTKGLAIVCVFGDPIMP